MAMMAKCAINVCSNQLRECSKSKIASEKLNDIWLTVNYVLLVTREAIYQVFSVVSMSLEKIVRKPPHSWPKIVICGKPYIICYILIGYINLLVYLGNQTLNPQETIPITPCGQAMVCDLYDSRILMRGERPRLDHQVPVSLRLMTSQFKNIVTHTQKYKTVKYKFLGVWIKFHT